MECLEPLSGRTLANFALTFPDVSTGDPSNHPDFLDLIWWWSSDTGSPGTESPINFPCALFSKAGFTLHTQALSEAHVTDYPIEWGLVVVLMNARIYGFVTQIYGFIIVQQHQLSTETEDVIYLWGKFKILWNCARKRHFRGYPFWASRRANSFNYGMSWAPTTVHGL